MSLSNHTIMQTSRLLNTRKISVQELVLEYIKEINEKNAEINCYITVCEDEALEQAKKAQKLLDSGQQVSPLCGIPMALKDNICTTNIKTTCGSKMLENFIPQYSSTVFEKLQGIGAVLLGKLNMDEFDMGSTTENSIFGPVRNPWNTENVAGGSSDGSAACVASNLACFALGSDTGGSIRQSASFCGIVGLKPTYGMISRYGLVAFASSLEQIGPLTKDVTDCALLMNAIVGHDPRDSTSIKSEPIDHIEGIKKGIKGLKIGIPSEFFDSTLDGDVQKVILETVTKLEGAGALASETSLPSIKNSIHAYYLISSSEASSNLARYDGIRYGYRNMKAKNISELYRLSRGEGFGREVKRRILLGTYALSSGHHHELYNKALKVRSMVSDQFSNAFKKFDILVAPAYPTTAFKFGLEDPLKLYLNDIYTVGANLAGLPALVVPCGLAPNGMPVGIQLIGKPFSEKLLLRAGREIEGIVGRLFIPQPKEGSHE